MNAKRGYVPEDERNFSPKAHETLHTASRHISYLINEGYDLKQATTCLDDPSTGRDHQGYSIKKQLFLFQFAI